MNARIGKTKVLSIFALVLMLLSVPVMGALAAQLLSLPPGPVSATHGLWAAGTMGSTIDVTLSGVPSGYDVMNGTYAGWCAEDNHMPTFPDDTLFILVDSTGDTSVPCPTYASHPWDKVNYLLNNPAGTVQDIQVALWKLTGTYDGTFPLTPAAQAMYDDAMLNGGGFVPGPDQVVAVILCGDGIRDGGYQDTLIGVPLEPPPDGEGCTPGFWRNRKKYDLWPIDPYTTLFSDVFGVGPADPLDDTIRLGGGGEKGLIRHGTAAYLNALSPDVAYFYAPAQVIAIVQQAYATGDFTGAKDTLEAQNDPTFCPLN